MNLIKYRLYIDEVGNPGRFSEKATEQYLCLTGVAFDLAYVSHCLQRNLELLKYSYFFPVPDCPIVLHRKDLMNGYPPFDALKDLNVAARWDQALLQFLEGLEMEVWTVLLDKAAYHRKLQGKDWDPYHYCARVLLERFTSWLEDKNAQGDVLAEGRGGKENTRLKAAYRDAWEKGTHMVPGELFQRRLTTRDLKIQSKAENIAGLQIADLLANAGYLLAKESYCEVPLPSNFDGRQICPLLREKMGGEAATAGEQSRLTFLP